MAESFGQAKAQQETLMTENQRLNIRLGKSVERLRDIGDKLLGSGPRAAASSTGQRDMPAPMPTLRRHIDGHHQWLSELEDELERIEAGL